MSDGLPRLDAGARKALALAAAAGRPPVQQMSPAEARDAARANQRLFDAEPPPTRRDDLFAPGIAGEIALRRYRPLDPENGGPVPALIFFHGGGWVTGDLDHGAWLCASLACQLGITVVSVGYRLAPEHPFPAAVEDSIAALEWVAANADALGLDPARLAVGGDSAGGALAAVAALHARDTGLTLRAQILLYPVTDNGDEHASLVSRALPGSRRSARLAGFAVARGSARGQPARLPAQLRLRPALRRGDRIRRAAAGSGRSGPA